MRILSVVGLIAAAGAAYAVPASPSGTWDALRPTSANANAPKAGQQNNAGVVDRQGDIVYAQRPDPVNVFGYFADGVPGQFYSQRIADDFVLGGSTSINGVRWWGSSENYVFPDLTNFSSWVVNIYNDNGGSVGASITGDMIFGAGSTNATATGRTSVVGSTEYVQNVKFNPVALQAGVRYWISIGTINTAPFDDAWTWHVSDQGNSTIAADFFDGAGYTTFPGNQDVAFELQAIPTPGAAALLGVAGLAGLRRRR
jgi:hypothetical protein